MKKLFGVVGLLFCVFLASCNFNNLSGKGGNIEFSIPLNDIVKLAEQRASREGGEEKQFEFVAMLQVKGSKNYYKSKTEIYDFGDSFYDGKAKTIEMSMSSLPSNQTYTVMFDLFSVNSVYKDTWLEVSGRTPNVAVTAGKTEEISLTAARSDEALVYLKVKLENSQSPINLSEGDTINIQKESDGLYFRDQKIKDIYLVLNSNANFTDSSFDYSLEYFSDAEAMTPVSQDLKFINDVCSIKDFLMKQTYFTSNEIKISKGDISFFTWLPYIVVKASNNSTQEFDPTLFYPKELTFVKTDQINNGPYRYVCTIPLSQLGIVNGRKGQVVTGISSIQDGRTLVITMDYDNSGTPDTFNTIDKFYYMLQPDNYTLMDLAYRYDGNNCVPLPTIDMGFTDNYELILPLNNLSNMSTNKNLILFFDNNSSDESFTITSELKGILLPSDTRVFSKTVNEDYKTNSMANPWRFELKEHIGDIAGLKNNGNITVKMSGIITEENVILRGEVYDTVDVEGNKYHPISNSSADGARLKVPVQNYIISGDNTDSFIFNEVKNIPESNDHDYYFQCTTDYIDGTDMLFITSFNLSYSLL